MDFLVHIWYTEKNIIYTKEQTAMKIAIIGSRSIKSINLDEIFPPYGTEIVSGGASGVDACAKEYAMKNNIKYTEFLPEYSKFGKSAPLRRNMEIIKHADIIFAFWDSKSPGTFHALVCAKKMRKPVHIELTN